MNSRSTWLRSRLAPAATYAAVGIEGTAAAGLDVESWLSLSEDGNLTGEAKLIYEREIVPLLVMQPRVGVSFAPQPVPEQGLASGFTDAEFALQLRYELDEQFKPYIGVSRMRLLGGTADLTRAAGETVKATDFVVGFSVSF